MGCLAGALLLSAGCGDDDKNTPIPVAFVSIYQASPDAPELGIVVDNRQINSFPFDYSEYTGYLRFYTGSRNLRFTPYGADNVVVDTTLNFEEGRAYSIFLVDDYKKADILVLEDVGDGTEGTAMIRFLNLSPDAAAVNLEAEGHAAPVFASQSFREPAVFKSLDPIVYDFRVESATGETLLELPDTQLQAGRFYTILMRGYQKPPAGNNNRLSGQILAE